MRDRLAPERLAEHRALYNARTQSPKHYEDFRDCSPVIVGDLLAEVEALQAELADLRGHHHSLRAAGGALRDRLQSVEAHLRYICTGVLACTAPGGVHQRLRDEVDRTLIATELDRR